MHKVVSSKMQIKLNIFMKENGSTGKGMVEGSRKQELINITEILCMIFGKEMATT